MQLSLRSLIKRDNQLQVSPIKMHAVRLELTNPLGSRFTVCRYCHSPIRAKLIANDKLEIGLLVCYRYTIATSNVAFRSRTDLPLCNRDNQSQASSAIK